MKDKNTPPSTVDNPDNQEDNPTSKASLFGEDLNISAVGFSDEDKALPEPIVTATFSFPESEFDEDLNRAQMLIGLKNFKAAEQIYRNILEEDRSQPAALRMLGKIAYEAGANEDAIDFIKMAIIEEPQYIDAYRDLGEIHYLLGQFEPAMETLVNALKLVPEDQQAGYYLAASLYELGLFEEAFEYGDNVILRNPNHTDGLHLIGNILFELGRHDDAIKILERAIIIAPSREEFYFVMGRSQMMLGRYEQALESMESALSIHPGDLDALSKLGELLHLLGKYEDANSLFRQATTIEPEFVEAQYKLTYSYLALGETKKGLEQYGWRWKCNGADERYRNSAIPEWDGRSEINDKTLLLWPEQDLHNVLTWSSAIERAAALSNKCIVEAHPNLTALFARSFPDVEIVEMQEEINANHFDADVHLPMGDIFLRTGVDEAAGCDAYLVPDAARVEYWRHRLKEIGDGPYVGIGWTGEEVSLEEAPNYTMIDHWQPVFDTDMTFISLQRGAANEALELAREEFGAKIHLFDDLQSLNDLDDVAALSAALDLVISPSTTTAAISAGVGTMTWLLSWTESMRNNLLHLPRGPHIQVFERSSADNWDVVFEQVSQNLSEPGIFKTIH